MGDRAQAWVNVLGQMPGTRDEKLRWLRSGMLDVIEGEAEASFVDREPTDRALAGKTRSLLIRYWRREMAGSSGANAPGRGGPRRACRACGTTRWSSLEGGRCQVCVRVPEAP